MIFWFTIRGLISELWGWILINTDLLKEYYPDIFINEDYIFVEKNVYDVINFLKTRNIICFDMLTEIMATDYRNFIQLSYNLFSTESKEFVKVMTNVYGSAKSVTALYKSANFNECEIYDLFGITFEGNNNLHRLYMPDTWKGHPLLKSYVQSDERLAWNE